MNPTIRQATIDDLETIVAYRRIMFEDMGWTEPAELDGAIDASRHVIHKGLGDATFYAWLAEIDGTVVACGAVLVSPYPASPSMPLPARATILNLCVAPAHRRRGIATRIMETMIAWCREQGFASVSLHASREGRPLYESMGFVPTSEMRLKLYKQQHAALPRSEARE